MEKVDVTWGLAAKVWWSFFWRTLVFGFLGGAIAGGVVGFYLGFTGKPELVPTYSALAGYIVGIPISLWVFKIILEKKFKGYYLAVIREEDT